MENQELPREQFSPEEKAEQFEQSDNNIESLNEESFEAELSDVNESIKRKNQIIEETISRIDEVRSGLGLPPSDETPPSLATEQKSLDDLNLEKADIEARMKEIENRATLKVGGVTTLTDSNDIQEYLRLEKELESTNNVLKNEDSPEKMQIFEGNLRNALDEVSIGSKTMFDALYERQEQGLTPLQSPDEFQGMVRHLNSLKNFDGKFDLEGLEQINGDIQKISNLMEDTHPRNTGGGVRENPENLEKLGYGARNFSMKLDEAGRNLGPELSDEKMEEKRKELRKSFGELSDKVQKLNSLSVRMREVL